MKNEVKGKVVVITGASSGIGEAIALMLAKEGAKVVLGARRSGRLEELVKRITKEGGLAFLAPNQIVTVSGEEGGYEGYALFFHPDLIRNYPLGNSILKYGFFSYAVAEVLFLSDKEKKAIALLFEAIGNELENNIDPFSQDVLVSQIELLLNYSNRFYNRQFITRKAVYHDLIGKLDVYLSERFNHKESPLTGLPSVQEVSDHLKVSPRYLSDMLKSLTGQTTQQHIHNKLIEKAKDILCSSSFTIAEIAYELGFEHP